MMVKVNTYTSQSGGNVTMRTIDEVRARFKEKQAAGTFLDFSVEVLSVHLPEGWKEEHKDKHKEYPLTEEFVKNELLSYLQFAFDKAINHRGISASRSVQKLSEWAWLLGLDDLVKFAENEDNYPQYGVPILKHFAKHFEVPLPEEIAAWEDGKACYPGCDNGCGKG